MADKRISQLIERTDILNNDVLPIVASGATTTNKVTISTIQDFMQSNLDVGVTSVGLTMPSAFQVSGSPITTSGNITVTAAGTASQYIRGDGTLADFPTGGGGGSSVSYYLNGSVSQGTIGGIAYQELSKTPILGAGTDFNISADGYIASFITDAGDPALLEIPAGNWNFETYLQASSGGGTPSFYIELYKVSGSTATLIASNSATPELIAFGNSINPYFSALAVPQTTLSLTDRLALRYYVTHSGRTITLHTENNTLCQVITTFTSGLTALNGLTAQVQNFATGTSGTDFNISSTGSIHTFNLPDASASNRGAVTTGSQIFGGVKTFANGLSLSAVGGSNQVTRIVNIGTLHEGSATLNQIGFNSGNNIYFGKGLSNGGVISWNNAAVRYYTLPDADGTIALTSDLGNYIQGVGTADSIPKFTGARTIANSAIRDTTSTVVISKNVSVDNGASQAINLTPASGGTTNRIETTGTLPLSLVTSGSSITLAAGGVTPQITLASTGAATFTGEVITNNGTNSTNGIKVISSLSSSLFTGGIEFIRTTVAAGSKIEPVRDAALGGVGLKFMTTANNAAESSGTYSTPLTLAPTGAATFSSSIQTGGNIVIRTGGYPLIDLGISNSNYFRFVYDNPNGTLVLSKDGGASLLSINSTGAATFSSSVTGTSFSLGTGNGRISTSGFWGTQITAGTGSFSNFALLDAATNGIMYNPAGTLNMVFTGNVQSVGLRSIDAANTWSFSTGSNSSTPNIVALGTISGTPSIQGFNFGFTANQNLCLQPQSGNVGIGTASPSNILHLFKSTFPILTIQSTSYQSSLGIDTNSGLLVLNNESNAALGFNTNNTERMRITSGGNVGIGTASPDRKLSLSVSPSATGDDGISISNGSTSFILTRTGSSYSYRGVPANAGMIYNGTNIALLADGANISFHNGNGESMRITSGGALQMSNNATTFSIGSIAGQNRIQWDSTEFAFLNTANSYTALGASAFNTRSDYRLKENVAPVQDALSKITSLKPCTFNFIAEPEKEVVGFIAHEVQEVFPQAISGEKDAVRIEQVEVSPAELDEEGNIITEAVIEEKEIPVYQGIDHSKLVPLLVASIQELKAEIEALKSQING